MSSIQETKAHQDEATDALEEGNEEEIEVQKKALLLRNQHLAQSMVQGDLAGAAVLSSKKKPRYSAQLVLTAISKNLTQYTGQSLGYFKYDDVKWDPVCPCKWPHLSCSSDQGPDQAAAAQYAISPDGGNFNVTWYHDPAHQLARDCKACVTDNGEWAHTLEMACGYSMAYRPFDTGENFNMIRSVMATYFALSDEECPLFNLYYHDLLVDFHKQHRYGEDGLRSEIWEEFKSCKLHTSKMDKISMVRWMSIQDAQQRMSGYWIVKKLQMLLVNISLGTISLGGLKLADRLVVESKAKLAKLSADLGSRLSMTEGQG